MAKENGDNFTGLCSTDAECKEEQFWFEDTDSIHSAATQVESNETQNNMNNKKQSTIIEDRIQKEKVQEEFSTPDIIDIADESSSDDTLSSECNSDSSSEVKKVTVTVTTISHKNSHRKKIKKKKVTTIKTQCRVNRRKANKKKNPLRSDDLNTKSAGAEKASGLFCKETKKITEHDKNQRHFSVKNEKPHDVQSTINTDFKPFTNIKHSNFTDEINVSKSSRTSAIPEKSDDLDDVLLHVDKLNVKSANADKSPSSLRNERKKSTEQDKNQPQAPLKNQKAQDVRFKTEKDIKPVTKVVSYLVEKMDVEGNSSPLENREDVGNRVEISEQSECEIFTIDEEELIDMNISDSSEIATPESVKMIKEMKYPQFGVGNLSDTKNGDFVKSHLFTNNSDTGCRRKIDFKREEAEDNCQEIQEFRGKISEDCQDIIVLSDSDEENNSYFKRSLQNKLLRENVENLKESSAEREKNEGEFSKDDAQLSRQGKNTDASECSNNEEESDFNKRAEKDAAKQNVSNIAFAKSASGQFSKSDKSVTSKMKEKKNIFDDRQKSTEEKTSLKRRHNDTSTLDEQKSGDEKRVRTEKKSGEEYRFDEGKRYRDDKRVERWLYDNRYYEENFSFNDIPAEDKNRHHEETRTHDENSVPEEKRLHEKKSLAGGGHLERLFAELKKRSLMEVQALYEKTTDNKNRFAEMRNHIENSSNIRSSEPMKNIKEEKKYSKFGVINLSDSKNGGFAKSRLFGANSEARGSHAMEIKDEKAEDSIEEIEENIDESEDIIVLSDSDDDANLSHKRSLPNQLFRVNRQNFFENTPGAKKVAVEYEKGNVQFSRHEKMAGEFSDANFSRECININEKSDFNERGGEDVEKKNSSAIRARFVVQKNGVCIDLVRTGRNWWNTVLSKPRNKRKIKKEKSVVDEKRARYQQKSGNKKISHKQTHNGIPDELKSADEKRARYQQKSGNEKISHKQTHNGIPDELKSADEKLAHIEKKSRDEDRCDEGEKSHDNNDRVVNEKHYHEYKFCEGKRSCDEDRFHVGKTSRDEKRDDVEKSLYDERDYDENRNSNDKRVDEKDRRHEETRVRDERIVFEEKRIYDEKKRCDEKSVREENRAHGEKILREEKRSAGEKRPDKERTFSEEKQISEENRFSEEKQSAKEIRFSEEKLRPEERQSAEEKRLPEERQSAEEKRLPEERQSAEVKRPAKERRFSEEKGPAKESRFSEEKGPSKEKRFSEEKRLTKEWQSSEGKGSSEERQSSGGKRSSEERQSLEEKVSAKDSRFSEEKRSSKERQSAEEKRLPEEKLLPEERHSAEVKRLPEERQSAEEKGPVKESRFSEEKRPKERRFSEEKRLAKEWQSSEGKGFSEERQSSGGKRSSEERQSLEEKVSAKDRRFSEEKRSSEERHSAKEKRSSKERQFAEEKRSSEDKRSAEKKRPAEKDRRSLDDRGFRGFDSHPDVNRSSDMRREHDERRFSEDKRSDHVHRKSPQSVSANDRENVENKENRAKSYKHDGGKAKNRQQNPAEFSDNDETPNRDKPISKTLPLLKDPRLRPNSHPIVLITKLGQIKKTVSIVEPPFLPKGDRRASCSNIINLNKSADKNETNYASPSTSQSSQPPAHEFPKKKEETKKNGPEKSAPKLSKRDLARKARAERKIHVTKQKWRRIKYPWTRDLPISKQPISKPFTPEERENIRSIRRKQLREIAEQHKSPANEESAAIPVAVSEENDELSAKRDAAQSAKVTVEPRGYFLFSKPLEQRAKNKSVKLKRSSMGKKNETEKKKINSRSSNADDKAIENSDESENEDECQNLKNNISEEQNSDDIETAENIGKQKSLLRETRKASEFSKTAKHVFFDDSATEIHLFEIEPGNKMRKFVPKDLIRWQRPTSNNVNQPVLEATDDKMYPKLEEFLAHIFEWNPRWLEEQIEMQMPPPIVDENKLTPMLSHYRTYEEYYKIAEPLLTLEMWYGISRDFEIGKTHLNYFSIVSNSINIIPNYFTNVRVSTLILEVVVSKRDLQLQAHPVYGDLLFFEYLSNRRDEHGFASWEVFAYVTSLRKTVITSLTNLNRDLINAVKDPHTLLTYTIMTKALDYTDIQTNRVNRLRTISYLRSNMRMVQALQDLPESPLMNIILHPKVENYQLPPANNVETYPLVTKDSLNTKQLEAVVKITNAVVQQLPKVCLIQGPPGTGKSKVIVNLVTQILYGDDRYHSDRKLKILVCAPSNAAVDEIVLRLLNVRKSFEKENRFNIVRTGRTETIHPSAKLVSLRELATKIVTREGNTYASTSISSDQDEIEKLERRNLAKIYREAEEQLLKGADVIASTLTSCYTNQMELLFRGSDESISVCIVDEATQSAEPETLIPLMLGVRTLVLVGDTNQLPATVLSQKAKQFGLDQSLFARIWRVFENEANNPIIQLDTQYRMTIPVAHFPNKYFYAGALTNAAKMHKLPFHFYRVINLDSTQDINKFSNVDEADFVANLIYTMIARTNYDNAILPVKVGIITPYNSQKILLRRRINERISRLKDKNRIVYEVNTVDSFQGQERDVIIMSCVRSNGIGFLSDRQRLCVALTRAKHSLILCGNFRTFHRDPMWKALLSDAQTRNVYINVKSNANPEAIRSHIIR